MNTQHARSLAFYLHYDPELPSWRLESERIIWHRGEPFTTAHEPVVTGTLFGLAVVKLTLESRLAAFELDVLRGLDLD